MSSRFTPPITGVESCSIADWEAEFARAAQATFFHSPLWSLVWQRYSGGRYQPAPLRVSFADGRSVLLARTVRRTRYGVLRWYLSPAGTYGGWLAAEALPDDHQRAMVGLIRSERSVIWFGWPGQSLTDQTTAVGTTHIIDLRDGVTAAHSRWDRGARRKLARARKAGIDIREAEAWNDWAAYFDNYLETRKLWESPTSYYGLPFFSLLYEARSPSVRLWLAEQRGSVVGGVLIFTHRNLATAWHGAQAPRGLGATSALYWEISTILASEGIEMFDLLPSGGHEGVDRYKESLGAELATFPCVLRQHPLERVARLAKRLPFAGVRV